MRELCLVSIIHTRCPLTRPISGWRMFGSESVTWHWATLICHRPSASCSQKHKEMNQRWSSVCDAGLTLHWHWSDPLFVCVAIDLAFVSKVCEIAHLATLCRIWLNVNILRSSHHQSLRYLRVGKNDTLPQCGFNVGPASKTVDQH